MLDLGAVLPKARVMFLSQCSITSCLAMLHGVNEGEMLSSGVTVVCFNRPFPTEKKSPSVNCASAQLLQHSPSLFHSSHYCGIRLFRCGFCLFTRVESFYARLCLRTVYQSVHDLLTLSLSRIPTPTVYCLNTDCSCFSTAIENNTDM